MGMRKKYPRVWDPNHKTFVPAFVILLNVVPKIKYLLSAWSCCDLATSCSIDFDAFQLQVVFEDFNEWSSVHSLLCDMILSTMYITIIIESSSLCALTNKGFSILVSMQMYWLCYFGIGFLKLHVSSVFQKSMAHYVMWAETLIMPFLSFNEWEPSGKLHNVYLSVKPLTCKSKHEEIEPYI